MSKNTKLNIKILDWFINWWDNDNNHTVCLLIDINGELKLIEKKLEQE